MKNIEPRKHPILERETKKAIIDSFKEVSIIIILLIPIQLAWMYFYKPRFDTDIPTMLLTVLLLGYCILVKYISRKLVPYLME